jgi:hypothetical protein
MELLDAEAPIEGYTPIPTDMGVSQFRYLDVLSRSSSCTLDLTSVLVCPGECTLERLIAWMTHEKELPGAY